MQNAAIIVLLGIVVVLLGVVYLGEDFNFSSNQNPEEVVEEAEKDTSTKATVSGSTKTPASAPTTSGTSGESNVEGVSKQITEFGVATVTYTNNGFVPSVIEVRAGDRVDFINQSNKALWVTADLHPTAKTQNYPEFDQGKTISNGGTYTFVFTKIGVWGYKNLNDPTHLGAVSVIQQF